MPYDDPRLVALYDADNPDGPDHDFYRSLAEENGSRRIVDLGCGTGILTVTLVGPGVEVVGVDPSAAMLDAARARDGGNRVTWVHGTSREIPFGGHDLVLMTGNVAQHIGASSWLGTLSDIGRALRPDGLLAFETRDPAARAWEHWSSAPTTRMTTAGLLVEWTDVELLAPGVVRISAGNRFEDGEVIHQVDDLTFRDEEELRRDLSTVGFDVTSVAGGWDGAEVGRDTGLLVVVARRRDGDPIAMTTRA